MVSGESPAPVTGRVVGVLLAGGRARRMGGGDKCLLACGDHTLLDRVIARARPQVETLILAANGDAGRFARFGLPVVGDAIGGFAGPLAGILAGLEWAEKHAPAAPWVASFATDTPFLPGDFVARALAALAADGAELACAASNGRIHPVCGIWPVRLAAALRHALTHEGLRRVDAWTGRYPYARVEFAGVEGADPFFNVNTPEDLAEAVQIAGRLAPLNEIR